MVGRITILAVSSVVANAHPVAAVPLESFRLQIVQATPSELPAETSVVDRTQIDSEIRSHQLQLHQGLAIATLGSMTLTAGLGLYTHHFAGSNEGTAQVIHMALGGLTTGLYLGAATLALTVPTGYQVHEHVGDAIWWHRYLAWFHAASLATTVTMGILAATGRLDPTVHGIAGGTALGLMALSAGVIALDF